MGICIVSRYREYTFGMMIWLIIFIISNYSLASSPPKVPGGVKRDIFSESRTLIHRAFSDRKYQNSFPKEWYLYFHSLCTFCHKKLCVFLTLSFLASIYSFIYVSI